MSKRFVEFDGAFEGYRLVNTKFPPIGLFDDVASEDEFDAVYEIQALTNPRLKAEVGELSMLPQSDIPFGINGCSYALAPFTHVNPDGSRFSDGSFGLLYIGNEEAVAIDEVKHHQEVMWKNIPELHFDRIVFKSLIVNFSVEKGLDACCVSMNNDMYDGFDYTASRIEGKKIKKDGRIDTLKYNSVRHDKGVCYALFTPKYVKSIIQGSHLEMVWSGETMNMSRITSSL